MDLVVWYFGNLAFSRCWFGLAWVVDCVAVVLGWCGMGLRGFALRGGFSLAEGGLDLRGLVGGFNLFWLGANLGVLLLWFGGCWLCWFAVAWL